MPSDGGRVALGLDTVLADPQLGKPGISRGPVISEDTPGLVTVEAEAEGHNVLGAHILASFAPDMIREGVLAVKHGRTLGDIRQGQIPRLVRHARGRALLRLSSC